MATKTQVSDRITKFFGAADDGSGTLNTISVDDFLGPGVDYDAAVERARAAAQNLKNRWEVSAPHLIPSLVIRAS